jgi:hypothetical protein
MLIPSVRVLVRILYVNIGRILNWMLFEGKVWGNICSANEDKYDMVAS